ncbi:MAG: hypothetical protein ACT4O3_05770 [Elusimicrobiota bacterium]
MKTRSNAISDAAVRDKTGKTWQDWVKVLDAAGAARMSHREIVALLNGYDVSPWWSQGITVVYERARGLREKYQTTSGYNATASKTFAVPVGTLYSHWRKDDARRRWLGISGVAVRKATTNRSLRAAWRDGKTDVTVNFFAKGAQKSQAAVQHSKLSDKAQAVRMKTFWMKALERLKEELEAKA